MSKARHLTNKAAYEATGPDGQILGATGALTLSRFRQTLKYIPKDTQSLLDAGCGCGHWLEYVTKRRKIPVRLGFDLSENRIQEAKKIYPHLCFKAGCLESHDIAPRTYDVVTLLEVLEHIPDWLSVLKSLLAIAKRRTVVSVPYKEKARYTLCIHCGKLSPIAGHLRLYDENTFPQQHGWRLSLGYIKHYGIAQGKARRIFRTIIPRRHWLIACYDARD